MKIGVLGLQGAVDEHIKQITALGLHGITIKHPEQLEQIDGLILPGGESTTISRLINRYGFAAPIKEFSKRKKPIFGTCAGMVLLAKELSASADSHLGLMDICVKRNAFGRQRDSFEAKLDVKGLADPFSAVFIRAPYVESAEAHVEVLATYNEHIVAARQEHLLVSSFHPELTGDTRFLELFVQMVTEYQESELIIS
ncbi:pyridoxal 5'-phosphate synthase glutaminase subunit PdxT [Oceanobacillus polygoni]|uniref:Pyridoxal 5'-phosphate synthase subunit PdxT n=1 Tax=Oceanobacillus polygoni TaxID=1235259 RepID=A0A9X0YXJ6_9BACI|nr:pyridoxal 5'-phosphate synthase glutaminase subunit PdxT [Oceanobacillus polygoni]MBP2078751.1 5'-phosphate synthase pdxT subunit [Oceanobacillus polygoni]